MFFNQIPQAQGMPAAPQMPQAPPMAGPANAVDPRLAQMMQAAQAQQQGMLPQGATTAPGAQPGQGTPGLDFIKLLMMMNRGQGAGAGPMSGGVGAVPPQSLNMPFSLSTDGPSGSSGNNILNLIGQIIKATQGPQAQTAMPTAAPSQ